jgi:ribosome maturation factor RimP
MLPTFFCSLPLPRIDVNLELEGVVRQELEARGFELFELRTGGTKNRPVLEVRIDRQDGGTVTIDDCAVASRAIEARLDGSDLVSDRYRLDVSSPGIERPLRGSRDWRRFVGKRATVTAQALPGGKAEVEIIGVEGEPGAEVGVVRDARGVEHRIALADVTQARLAFHWQR